MTSVRMLKPGDLFAVVCYRERLTAPIFLQLENRYVKLRRSDELLAACKPKNVLIATRTKFAWEVCIEVMRSSLHVL